MLTGLGGKIMAYDGENRPLSVTWLGKKTCYVYGVDGKRLKKVEGLTPTQDCTALPTGAATTVYFGAVEVRKWKVSGQEQVLTYPHPAVKLLNGYTAAAATYLHRDGLLSVRAITSAAGIKLEAALYKPFGEQSEWLLPGNTSPETKGWIGERFDADAGLQYLNARYYDPELSLFLQPDWFEVTKPGVGTNRFSYSFNDPVNKLDPGGNSWLDRAWDGVFGKDSFNRTFGDSGSAWSDRTFGVGAEKMAADTYDLEGYKSRPTVFRERYESYDDFRADIAFGASGTAAQGDSFVLDVATVATGGVVLKNGAVWVGKGVLNSYKGARVFWTGKNAAGVGARAAAEAHATATGATTLEMTLTGKVMDFLHNTKILGTDRPIFGFSDEAWNWASARFANGATSATVVMGTSVRAGSTWETFEAPALLRNGIDWAVKIWE